MAATVAPVNVSGGAVRLRIGLFHLATITMTPRNDRKFTANAPATPATAITTPASAGPTARARLNSIPFSADAAARSSLGTNSGRIARHDGVSNASPDDSANANISNNQGDMNPPMVSTQRRSATLAIHTSAARISLRRSTISPAEPAGSDSRKYGRDEAVCVSAT